LRLLVTRPDPDGARTAEALRARGHQVLLAPLSRIRPIAAEIGPGPFAALLVGSANAVRALEIHPQRQQLMGLPVLAVGDRSTAAARQAGFADVVSAAGDGADLIDLAVARYRGSPRPLLHLAGADRALDLVAALASAAVPAEIAVIYQSIMDPSLPPAVTEGLRTGGVDGVLHFSRRAAETFLEAAARAGLHDMTPNWVHFCLSGRIAEPLAAANATNIRVAADPTEDALLQLIDAA
jgi:uroporphyrinogen-III synthase